MSTTLPVQVLSETMIIITSASRKVMVKPGVRNWNVPELLSWYFFSISNGSSRLRVPALTAASAAIMIEILRVLADGKTVSPLRSATWPVWRSFRYQPVGYGCSSQRALSSSIKSCIFGSLLTLAGIAAGLAGAAHHQMVDRVDGRRRHVYQPPQF